MFIADIQHALLGLQRTPKALRKDKFISRSKMNTCAVTSPCGFLKDEKQTTEAQLISTVNWLMNANEERRGHKHSQCNIHSNSL